MSNNLHAFINATVAHHKQNPVSWFGQGTQPVPGTMASAIVPLKMKVWRKLDAKVKTFSQMAKEDWPEIFPSPSEQLEVFGLVLKKKLASYPEMQEVHDPVELTKLADAINKASGTLENVLLLVGQLKEEYEAAKAAEDAFVKTLT